MDIQETLLSGTQEEILATFHFKSSDAKDLILVKFNLWVRYFFPSFFASKDAEFHNEIDKYNLMVYKGELKSFVDCVFRGGGKTLRTKMFVAFVIANDTDHSHRYFKVLTKDLGNAKQTVTDIYNIFIDSRVLSFYPEIFAKTVAKREETMSSFTTSTGIRVTAGTVGTDQRGALQEDARPSFIWFDDVETRKTLRSAVETKAIGDNMEEARTGLTKDGGCVTTCNYISERGNVHKLIQKGNKENKVLIVPIRDKQGKSNWSYYSEEDIDRIKRDAEDFEGEYNCLKPNTLISTDKGLREIQTLKVGDLVWTHLNRLQKILTVFQRQADDLLDITVNNKIITITKNHPVLVKKGNSSVWKPAGELLMTDLLLKTRRGNL